MSDNTLFAINVVLRILAGIAAIVVGAYLILHKHIVAGGWTIGGGIMLACVSYSSSEDDGESDD